MARRIVKTKGENLGVFKDQVSVTLMLPGRTAWALGVLSRIQGVSLGKLCANALEELTENQGIPWSRYTEIRKTLVPETQRKEGGAAVESGENQSPLVPGDSGDSEASIPPAPLSVAGGEEGSLAPAPIDAAKAERAKKVAREIGARQRRAG